MKTLHGESKVNKYTLHFDGSCWPNPAGVAAYGYVLQDTTKGVLRQEHAVIGQGEGTSNNVAEFEAAFQGLCDYSRLPAKPGDVVEVLGDSDLVVKIMNKVWRPSQDKLYYPYFVKLDRLVRALRGEGVAISFRWVPREENTMCDDLSKAHLK